MQSRSTSLTGRQWGVQGVNVMPAQLIRPAKSNLKRVMELGNGAVAAHKQATPDLQTGLSYPDAQLIHLYCLVCTAHAFLC